MRSVSYLEILYNAREKAEIEDAKNKRRRNLIIIFSAMLIIAFVLFLIFKPKQPEELTESMNPDVESEAFFELYSDGTDCTVFHIHPRGRHAAALCIGKTENSGLVVCDILRDENDEQYAETYVQNIELCKEYIVKIDWETSFYVGFVICSKIPELPANDMAHKVFTLDDELYVFSLTYLEPYIDSKTEIANTDGSSPRFYTVEKGTPFMFGFDLSCFVSERDPSITASWGKAYRDRVIDSIVIETDSEHFEDYVRHYTDYFSLLNSEEYKEVMLSNDYTTITIRGTIDEIEKYFNLTESFDYPQDSGLVQPSEPFFDFSFTMMKEYSYLISGVPNSTVITLELIDTETGECFYRTENPHKLIGKTIDDIRIVN